MAITIIPTANIPLPDDFDSEEPTTLEQKVKVAAKTMQVLDEAGAEIPVSTQEKKEAEEIFKNYTNPDVTPPLNAATKQSLNVPATVQHLYAMLSDYDHQVVEEAVQLRRFITNKLIEDTNHTDARHRLRALELLGKISDVGLFSEKTEVVVKHASPEDLENQIKNKLAKLITRGKTIDASIDDIEGEMGTVDEDDNTDEE